MDVNTGNLFQALPIDLSEEVFQTLISAGQLKVERIVSNGHRSAADFWYDQPQNEWVVLLKGAAIVQIEGMPDQHLEPGCYLDPPAHTRHRVAWTTPETETVWLAVHYSGTAD